jgi:superfamily II DNA or RNA helicase
MQVGPVRHTIALSRDPAGQDTLLGAGRPAPVLYVHPTAYRYDGDADPSRPGGMTTIYRHLAADEQRTRQVIADVLAALSKDRNCLVLTNRTSHPEKFAGLLREAGHDPVILRGGMGAKSRAAALARLQPQPGGPPLLVVATGPYAGEGFDCPALDTLFLAAPLANKGSLTQYVGRILRSHETRPRPRSTTTSMSGLESSPPCSPNARPATPASASPTRAGLHSRQAPAQTANQPRNITLV